MYLFIFLSLLSCSWLPQKKNTFQDEFQPITSKTYLTFLDLKSQKLQKDKKLFFNLSNKEKKYLSNLTDEILKPNKKFFKKIKKINYKIIKSENPFYFSTPPNTIFLSTSLMKDFVENESFLANIISYELVKIEHHLYPKKILAPIGVSGVKELIDLTMVDSAMRSDIHKWAYYLLKRSYFDIDTYLLFMQIVNRNSKKFEFHFAGHKNTLQEERNFKAFIINEGKKENTTFVIKEKQRKSFPIFYSLIERIENAR